jgi:hypothetical protein
MKKQKRMLTSHSATELPLPGGGGRTGPMAKEPKIIEHEPTAVKREMTEKITDPGQTGSNPEEAAEIGRKKGMANGMAGAAETGSEYEQGTSYF